MILIWLALAVVALFGLSAFVGAPYVPTLQAELRRAFTKLYPVSKGDVVVDLGAGDGRVLVEAVRCGARGYGYEINPLLVLAAKLRLKNTASVRLADMWSVKLPPDTTLVYIFTVSRDSKRLGRYLQAQADAGNRSLHVMTFGPTLVDYEPVKVHRGHSLYEIQPSA